MQRRAGAKFAAAVFIFFVSGCAAIAPEKPQSEKPQSAAVSWADIPGWAEDSHAEALPVFLRSCKKLSGAWRPACDAAKNIPADNDSVRRFFEKYFSPRKMLNKDGGGGGLITGYYEPLLHGAPSPSERFRHPVYAPPAGLLHVELGGLYPELKNKRVRGRAENGKVIPYYSRAEIDGKTAPLAGG
ncbi:MAG: hypothetical protein HAW59_05285, partial [Betaproteobacteria bacterium]|nr:hypothetical protein [Betaproteobacteria bacterium]